MDAQGRAAVPRAELCAEEGGGCEEGLLGVVEDEKVGDVLLSPYCELTIVNDSRESKQRRRLERLADLLRKKAHFGTWRARFSQVLVRPSPPNLPTF